MSDYWTWTFSIVAGYNKILLSYPKKVFKGQMIYLQQTTANVSLDITGAADYPDLAWNNYLQKISPTSNIRFYLEPITNYTTYETSVSLYHTYPDVGLYSLKFSFSESTKVYQEIVNITDCKSLFILL